LELLPQLVSAERCFLEAALELGCRNEAEARRILEVVGQGKILDAGAPLVLRPVERWIGDLLEQVIGQEEAPDRLPEPRHMPSDRYLEHLDDEEREKVLKKYLPEYFQTPGGVGIIKDPAECLQIMLRWEEIFSSENFQKARKDLWARRDLNFPSRLVEMRKIVCTFVAEVLEPMGFAEGQPGLTRTIRQMQVYWSKDKACACKALDLEELADVSLADLQ